LKDALGSTIALVDVNGNIQTSYTYDPYGGTSVTGTSNGNEFQYTGRENEGNGLYFYRARYYSPLLGRFIGEDPLGFLGGDTNFYAYTGDDPADFRDVFGLSRDCFPRNCGGLPPDPWDKPKHLTDCAKNHLKQYFPAINLDSVPFYEGTPWWVRPGYPAITLRDGIYYDATAGFGGTPSGLGAIGHELQHRVQQHWDPQFFTTYLGQAIHASMQPGDTHDNIPYEWDAIHMGDTIEMQLAGRYGLLTSVCESVLQ
jgi:RHS repeat-associated protein